MQPRVRAEHPVPNRARSLSSARSEERRALLERERLVAAWLRSLSSRYGPRLPQGR